MKTSAVFGTCVCFFVVASVALAPGALAQARATLPAPSADDAAMAKMRFERGMAHYQLDEFKAAIEQWEEGFRLKPDPSFLYNIGQAYRLSKQPEKAITFYGKYLKMNPKAPNRAEVERHIANLQKELDERASAPTTAPALANQAELGPAPAPTQPRPAAVTSAQANATAPVTAPPIPVATPQDEPAGDLPGRVDLTATTVPPEPTPVYKTAWFWGVVGVTVAAAAVVTIVLVSRDSGSDVRQLGKVVF